MTFMNLYVTFRVDLDYSGDTEQYPWHVIREPPIASLSLVDRHKVLKPPFPVEKKAGLALYPCGQKFGGSTF